MPKPKRTLRNKTLQLELILKQECRCAYCNRPLLGLHIQWDHFIPYSYKKFVEDNLKKKARIFNEDTLAEFITDRILEYGDLSEGVPEGHDEYWIREYAKQGVKRKINPPIEGSEELLN